MPAEPPKPDPIVIVAYLDDVDGELEAARRLSEAPPSRFAAFHLQQAAEKLVKAIKLHRGLFASADHNILALIEELPLGRRMAREVVSPWSAVRLRDDIPVPVTYGEAKAWPQQQGGPPVDRDDRRTRPRFACPSLHEAPEIGETQDHSARQSRLAPMRGR
jgi:hypothetical protein